MTMTSVDALAAKQKQVKDDLMDEVMLSCSVGASSINGGEWGDENAEVPTTPSPQFEQMLVRLGVDEEAVAAAMPSESGSTPASRAFDCALGGAVSQRRSTLLQTPINRLQYHVHLVCPGAPMKSKARTRRRHSETLRRLMRPLNFETLESPQLVA